MDQVLGISGVLWIGNEINASWQLISLLCCFVGKGTSFHGLDHSCTFFVQFYFPKLLQKEKTCVAIDFEGNPIEQTSVLQNMIASLVTSFEDHSRCKYDVIVNIISYTKYI